LIAYLNGEILWYAENELAVEVNNIAYLVEISEDFKKTSPGKNIEIYIYTYVREDAIKLFGFKSMNERELFKLLLSVSGIGPSVGMNIISMLDINSFINAILTENIDTLTQISGIGPKTARRLILELQSKINKLADRLELETVSTNRDEDLFEALIGLGYRRKEIDNAVVNLDFAETVSLEEKIRLVLNYLGREKD